ncbi:hypothetical protein NRA21_15495, partial [Acinetobacter baumannii]|nr:hypothetical protein [Acinetobacter baumannii]
SDGQHHRYARLYTRVTWYVVCQVVENDDIFFQEEEGIRVFCLSRGLGIVYKRQGSSLLMNSKVSPFAKFRANPGADSSL